MTAFSYIFDEFLDKITDPDLMMLLSSEDYHDEIVEALVLKAASKVRRDFEPSVDLYSGNISIIHH